MPTPIVYLAFANDPQDHLDLLKAESSALKQRLIGLDQAYQIELHRDESMEVRDLFDTLNTYGDRLRLFHYAGHANSAYLKLEDGEFGAGGLAQKLLQSKDSLQLVVLNGCATAQQVDALLQGGIPAVIATSVEIADPAAKDFATELYDCLGKEKSLKVSFDSAMALVRGKYQDRFKAGEEAIAYRSLLSRSEPRDHRESLPWKLYVREDRRDVLDWKLSDPLPEAGVEGPVPVCLIYDWQSEKDKKWGAQLVKALENMEAHQEISLWHYDDLTAGTGIQAEITRQLKEARIFILLVSSDSLHREAVCRNLIEQALRQTRERSATFLPVMLRTTSLRRAPFRKPPYDYKAILQDKPLASEAWQANRDAAYVAIEDEIFDKIEELNGMR
jgi:hypothetical protein